MKWLFLPRCIQNPKCASNSKWCHQMLQNDVIKCCKMISSNVALLHSNNCCVVLKPAICEDLGLHITIFVSLVYHNTPDSQCLLKSQINIYIYCLETKFGKVIFLHLSVILFTGGGQSVSVHAGIHTPPEQTPQEQTPPRADTPKQTPPWEQTPSLGEQNLPPGADTSPGTDIAPHLCSVCWEIRATSGWYASYWNAYL